MPLKRDEKLYKLAFYSDLNVVAVFLLLQVLLEIILEIIYGMCEPNLFNPDNFGKLQENLQI